MQQEWFLATAAAFFHKADGAQLRLAGRKCKLHCEPRHITEPAVAVAKICATFVRVSLDLGKALEGILPLRAAMQIIRPAPTCLTPAHVGYLQVSKLKSRITFELLNLGVGCGSSVCRLSSIMLPYRTWQRVSHRSILALAFRQETFCCISYLLEEFSWVSSGSRTRADVSHRSTI